MEDTSTGSFTHACVCNPGTNEKYWTHFVVKKVESCYFNVYLTCNSLASFRCQLVWGAAQKMMSKKIREKHAERKQKNVLRNLTRLKIISPTYILPFVQGPITCLLACGFQLPADVLRNNSPAL